MRLIRKQTRINAYKGCLTFRESERSFAQFAVLLLRMQQPFHQAVTFRKQSEDLLERYAGSPGRGRISMDSLTIPDEQT